MPRNKAASLNASAVIRRLDAVDSVDNTDDMTEGRQEEYRGFSPWQDVNIGSPSYFRSMSFCGLQFTFIGTENHMNIFHHGQFEAVFPRDSVDPISPINMTQSELFAWSLKEGLKLIDAHREQYIYEARDSGVELEPEKAA